jgi:hypothetical protein
MARIFDVGVGFLIKKIRPRKVASKASEAVLARRRLKTPKKSTPPKMLKAGTTYLNNSKRLWLTYQPKILIWDRSRHFTIKVPRAKLLAYIRATHN